jgi:hypothetical protein
MSIDADELERAKQINRSLKPTIMPLDLPLTAEVEVSLQQISNNSVQSFIRKYWSNSPFGFQRMIQMCLSLQSFPTNDEYGIHEKAMTVTLTGVIERFRKDDVSDAVIKAICDGLAKYYPIIGKIQAKQLK